MKKLLIAIAAIVVVGILVVVNLRREGKRIEVRVTEVTRRDITRYITASGRIRAKRQLDVSATAIGKVTKVAVKEGDYVKKGDFLLEIDPTAYESAVDQLKASMRSAEATLQIERANHQKARYDLERAEKLHQSGAVSEEELRNARINVDVYDGRVRAAEESLAQYRANLRKASHDLAEVRIIANMSGVITALNVEEGESAIMGTLNNPGTVLLTIADLREIEAEVEVDETEVVSIKTGQPVEVTLDAYPDRTFAGKVVEVGNSAIRTQVGFGQSSVDFKVVVAVTDEIPNVKPGLSASARIKVAETAGALAIPIQCLTVRQARELADGRNGEDGDDTEAANDDEDIEGVFAVRDGVVEYVPVKVGIAGSSYFEVIEGLSEGDVVVSGPFKAINDLRPGDRVKIEKKSSSR